MACGLPVVCTQVAGCVPDLLEDGWNGRVLAVGNIEALVQALEDLARNPEKIREMAENSRKRILNFSPEICANGMAEAAFSVKKQSYE